jgi:Cu/Ag efflux protein CusF
MHRSLAVLLLTAVLGGCNRAPSALKESNEPVKQYALRGSVLRLDADGHIATIKNEKIEGWMEPMAMDFPVKDQADFDKLHAGDTIRATVFVQGLQYWVGNVQPEK